MAQELKVKMIYVVTTLSTLNLTVTGIVALNLFSVNSSVTFINIYNNAFTYLISHISLDEMN